MRILLSILFALTAFPAVGQVCDPDQGGLESCSDTAELLLSGTVTTTCAIEVEPTAEATALDIQGGETGTIVATATEVSNNLAGYKVFASSANGGELVNATDATATVPYQLSYNSGSLFSPTTTALEVKDSGTLSGFTSATSDIAITFAGDSSAIAGTYSDVVTFEIQAL